jgi:hypothetical protein
MQEQQHARMYDERWFCRSLRDWEAACLITHKCTVEHESRAALPGAGQVGLGNRLIR